MLLLVKCVRSLESSSAILAMYVNVLNKELGSFNHLLFAWSDDGADFFVYKRVDVVMFNAESRCTS